MIAIRVYNFNDCTEAAEELKQQIEEAKADLTKKGLKF
jgi:dolichyl-phosphate mannosyltransferase polypeptide 3